jgi:hypothetical protein
LAEFNKGVFGCDLVKKESTPLSIIKPKLVKPRRKRKVLLIDVVVLYRTKKKLAKNKHNQQQQQQRSIMVRFDFTIDRE